MNINGEKFSSLDIEGTDLEAVKKFCHKNKVEAAVMIYLDKDLEFEFVGFWFKARARDKLYRLISKLQKK